MCAAAVREGSRYGKQRASLLPSTGAVGCYKPGARWRPQREGPSSHGLLPYPSNCAACRNRVLRRDEDRFPLHAPPNAYGSFLAPQRNPASRFLYTSISEVVAPLLAVLPAHFLVQLHAGIP